MGRHSPLTGAAQAVAIIVLVVAGLALAEGVVRLYSPPLFPKMMVLDQRLGWKHETNVTKIFVNEDSERVTVIQNQHGLRGPVPTATKGPRSRVLVLGDSFTEGVQAGEEDLVTARLQAPSPRLEVLNAGVGGYGTVQEYLYLRDDGSRLHPDIVLVMFYDDLSRNCLSYYPRFGLRPYARLNGSEVQIVEAADWSAFARFTIPVPFRPFLARHSYLYYFANTYVYQPLFGERMRDRLRQDLRRANECGPYQVFHGLVAKMREAAREQGAFLALIPSREEVELGAAKVQEAILESCRRDGLGCLSLLEDLVAARRSGARVYFDRDLHRTRAGHRVTAGTLQRFLEGIL